MSSSPKTFDRERGKRPTGEVTRRPDSMLLQIPSSHSSPHGYLSPSGPRAAASHSYSLGKRPPAHAAKASASQKETPNTGWFGPFHFAFRQNRGSPTPSSLNQRRPSSD